MDNFNQQQIGEQFHNKTMFARNELEDDDNSDNESIEMENENMHENHKNVTTSEQTPHWNASNVAEYLRQAAENQKNISVPFPQFGHPRFTFREFPHSVLDASKEEQFSNSTKEMDFPQNVRETQEHGSILHNEEDSLKPNDLMNELPSLPLLIPSEGSSLQQDATLASSSHQNPTIVLPLNQNLANKTMFVKNEMEDDDDDSDDASIEMKNEIADKVGDINETHENDNTTEQTTHWNASKVSEYLREAVNKKNIFLGHLFESYQYSCEHCEYKTTDQKGFKQHAKSIHGEIQHHCHLCDYKAKQRASLTQHIASVHEGVEYRCEQCDYKSTDKGNLRRHVKSEHKGVRYQCLLCDYAAKQKVALKQHEASMHEGVKYECDQCDYKATAKGSLVQHIASIHDGVKYDCDQCGYKATRKSYLSAHMQSAHMGVRFECEQCEYKAAKKGSLVQHVATVHTGIRFNCDQCDYKARQKGHLVHHIASVHEGIKYRCGQCGYKSTIKGKLLKHLATAH